MPLVATAAAAGQAAIPPSLQELICDMEASDNQNVSTDLARKAKDLIADAIGGSMCEKKLGRRIPLAEALQHSRVELIAAVNEYSRVVSGSSIVMNMMFREAFNPVKSKKVISRELVKKFIALDFTGFGISEYECIQTAMIKRDGGEGMSDEAFVINEFCERMGKLLYLVSKKIGHDIAKARMPPITSVSVANPIVLASATTAQAGANIPPSLQQLVHKMEALDDTSVSIDLVRYANALFDAVFNGSAKRVPLADALQRCGGELISKVNDYNHSVSNVLSKVKLPAGCISYYYDKATQKVIEDMIALDFTEIGLDEYEALVAALHSLEGGPHKNEIDVVKQFCDRMSKLLYTVKKKIGYDIAKPPKQLSSA